MKRIIAVLSLAATLLSPGLATAAPKASASSPSRFDRVKATTMKYAVPLTSAATNYSTVSAMTHDPRLAVGAGVASYAIMRAAYAANRGSKRAQPRSTAPSSGAARRTGSTPDAKKK